VVQAGSKPEVDVMCSWFSSSKKLVERTNLITLLFRVGLSVLSDMFQDLTNLTCQGRVVCNMSENAFDAWKQICKRSRWYW